MADVKWLIVLIEHQDRIVYHGLKYSPEINLASLPDVRVEQTVSKLSLKPNAPIIYERCRFSKYYLRRTGILVSTAVSK
jgi:hypothetical protein